MVLVNRTAQTVPAAIAHLLDEHVEGYRRFDALEAAVAAARLDDAGALTAALAEAEEALGYLAGALEIHIAKEEGPLFPRLKAALPPGDRLIDEMVAEHDLIRIKGDDLRAVLDGLLGGHDDVLVDLATVRERLASLSPSGPRLTRELGELEAAVHALVEKARVHFENEEELVFPLAPVLLDVAALDAIMVEIAAIDAI
jgi:iron-sulfur cluster repair protein YtfE (RIC family)